MKHLLFSIAYLFSFSSCAQKSDAPLIVSSDIELFWNVYDKVIATDDRLQQLHIVQNEYIAKGSQGLKSIINKRGYTADSYVTAIRTAPSFWESVRHNTYQSGKYATQIAKDIASLKTLYPQLQPAQIFFTIGAMRTGGSAHQGHVLIGAELAMADSSVISKDIQPEWLRENLAVYFNSNPINDLVLLNVHEYVHTQQGKYGNNLLAMAVFEGVAEFVSTLAAGRPSASPAIPFGQNDFQAVRERFEKEMFSPNWNDWLYNDFSNEFGIRDLGYYVGYEICVQFYEKAEHKMMAVKEMIELDCSDDREVREFVKRSGYLSKDYDKLKDLYSRNKPEVTGVLELMEGFHNVDASLKTLTINFSKPMNPRFKNFKVGKKGQKYLLPVEGHEWSDDHRSLILMVALEPGKRYQLIVDSEFRDMEGRSISRYNIDLKTRR